MFSKTMPINFNFLFLTVFLISLTKSAFTADEDIIDELGRSPCAIIHDLHKCMAHTGCGYCVKQDYDQPNRCDTFQRLKATNCEKDIFEPVENKKEAKVEPNKNVDNITVHLLPGMTRNITVTFSLLAHPIDLYYLMDFSGSMSGDKNNLVAIAENLKQTIGNITTDYRLGLGSFVDKPAPNKQLGGPNDYVFKNRMSLTNITTNFANIVQNTSILSGGDSPEATGEAMLQAIVCKNEIGWRDNSRRILLVATDVQFHVAGDGKIGGITTPNDGLCHLNSSGDYTAQLTQDYPSLDQLRSAIEANSIITIFAVRAKNDASFYEKFVNTTKAASFADLQADSKNILELINKAYDDIHSRIELQHTNTTTNDLSVKIFSSCHGTSEIETNICDKLPKTGTVSFTVSIDLRSCPKDKKDWNQKITVSPIGLPIHLEIEARLVCETI